MPNGYPFLKGRLSRPSHTGSKIYRMIRALSALASIAGAGLTLSACTIVIGGDAQRTTSTTTVYATPEAPASAAEPADATGQGPDLQAAVDQAVAAYGGTAGVAYSDGEQAWSFGDDAAYPAWSTSKVPIAIAALRQNPDNYSLVQSAITVSDNAAAESLWQSLPAGAASQVLQEAGVPIEINTAITRPEFTAFGQTLMSPSQQAKFAANLQCLAGASQVVSLMGQVSPDQAYGLGELPGARFKGGWGPDASGLYQVRQFGLASNASGDVALALTAIPASGTYADAQAMASLIAQSVSDSLDSLPNSAC